MFKTNTLLAALLSAALVGCGSDDNNSSSNNNDNTDETSTPLTLSFKDSGDAEPEYLINEEDLSTGNISAQGTGTEQLGWNFYYPVGNTLFVSGYQDFKTVSYQIDDNGDLFELNTFLFDTPLETFGNNDDATLLATTLPRDGTHADLTLYTVDASNGRATSKVTYNIEDDEGAAAGDGSVAAPTALIVRGDKLFVSYHKWDDNQPTNYSSVDVNSAYVAVYDYPLTDGANPIKIISDDRTSQIGVNGSSTNMIKLENGDIYTYSNGTVAAGFDPATTRPSGLLRIQDGTTDFDSEYFFDIEDAAGGTIFWMDKIGGTKALARILMPNAEADVIPWSAFGKDYFTQKLVLLDLEAKTVTDVSGVPLHQKRYSSPVEVIDGKVYLSIETADEANIYEYDVSTNTATKGAVLSGKTIKGFYDLAN